MNNLADRLGKVLKALLKRFESFAPGAWCNSEVWGEGAAEQLRAALTWGL